MSGSRPVSRPIPLADLRRSWLATDPEVAEAAARVLASGWYIRGPEHDAFEAELAAFLGLGYACGVASGTDALVLALQAVGCGSGAEVVTAANAGGYATNAALQLGCRVVYADVDRSSQVVTPATVEAVLGPETRAVVVTHLYGNVADAATITALCRGRGIAVVEDCAQAIGGERDGRRAGAFGDVATLSFYPTKNLGTAGDGGAVATDDPGIAARVRSLRQYGWSTRYTVQDPLGRNSRLDEVQAAILRIGLRRVDAWNERRRAIVDHYAAALLSTGAPDVTMVTGAGVPTVAHLAVVRSTRRDDLRARLHAAGVGTDVHSPVPDHRQPGLPSPARRSALPETERAVAEVLTVPCFPDLTDDEVERISHALASSSA